MCVVRGCRNKKSLSALLQLCLVGEIKLAGCFLVIMMRILEDETSHMVSVQNNNLVHPPPPSLCFFPPFLSGRSVSVQWTVRGQIVFHMVGDDLRAFGSCRSTQIFHSCELLEVHDKNVHGGPVGVLSCFLKLKVLQEYRV